MEKNGVLQKVNKLSLLVKNQFIKIDLVDDRHKPVYLYMLVEKYRLMF